MNTKLMCVSIQQQREEVEVDEMVMIEEDDLRC
jgi:hypothetical protein